MEQLVKTRVVGIDISLDFTTIAIVDARGMIVAQTQFVTTDYPVIGEYVNALAENILQLVEDNGGYESIRSVGISAPSGNYMTGCIESSPNMPWKGVIPLAALLRDHLGLAVALGNDAHIRALGEHSFGVAHGLEDFIIVTIGNGVGSCFVSRGRAHLGNDGFAGEFGHNCVVAGGRACGCGNKGCLESYCAARGVLQTARELLDEYPDKPSLMRDERDSLTAKRITEFCEQGDELAIEVYRRTGTTLGTALANYASIVDPEAIVFTGGISKAGKWLLDPAHEAFEEHVFHNIKGRVRFLQSELSEQERDVLGASVLAWNIKEYSLFK